MAANPKLIKDEYTDKYLNESFLHNKILFNPAKACLRDHFINNNYRDRQAFHNTQQEFVLDRFQMIQEQVKRSKGLENVRRSHGSLPYL